MGSLIAVAAPPASKYNPGETLDPTCGPGDTNCTVQLPSGGGGGGTFAWTPESSGNATSTNLILKSGFVSSASSTINGSTTIGTSGDNFIISNYDYGVATLPTITPVNDAGIGITNIGIWRGALAVAENTDNAENPLILLGEGGLLDSAIIGYATSTDSLAFTGGTGGYSFDADIRAASDIYATDLVDASYFVATSSSATSTFAGNLTVGGNASITGNTTFLAGIRDGSSSFGTNNYVLATNGTNEVTWTDPNTLVSGGGSFAWTPETSGNATSTTLIFKQGFVSSASTTVNSDFSVGGNATTTGYATFLAGIKDGSSSFGTNNYVLATNGTNEVTWTDPNTLVSGGGGTFAWTPESSGNATSTNLILKSGFVSSASTTLAATTTFASDVIVDGNIEISETTNANQDGIIYKGSFPFIHDFNYGDNGSVTTAGRNIFIGENAGNLTMGSTATFFYQSSYNVGIGYQSLSSNTLGRDNTGVGDQALLSNTSGNFNTAIGEYALRSNTTAEYNTAVGERALWTNSTGHSNAAVGNSGLGSNTTGNYNSSVGRAALSQNITGSYNTALGASALQNNTSATNTVAIGYQAAVGSSGVYSNQNGVYVGYQAGTMVQDGSNNNTFIGYRAGDNVTTGASNLLIGYDIEAQSATGDNQLSIGNLIFGTGIDGTGTTISTGNIGIGDASPASLFTVGASDAFQIDNSGEVGAGTWDAGTVRYDAGNSGILHMTQGTALGESTTGVRLNVIGGTDGVNRAGVVAFRNESSNIDFHIGIATTSRLKIVSDDGGAGSKTLMHFISQGGVVVPGDDNPFIVGQTDEGRALISTATSTIPGSNGQNTGMWATIIGGTDSVARPAGVHIRQESNGRDFAFYIDDADSDLKITSDNAGGGDIEIMNIQTDGDVGIGAATPGVRLHVQNSIDGNIFRLQDSDGTCNYNPESGSVSVSCSSDESLKSNIINATSTLGDIMKYQVREYNVIGSDDRVKGVIAQELQEDLPDRVYEGEDGILMVDLPNVWDLVLSIQELAKNISDFAVSVTTETLSAVTGIFENVTTEELCVGETCINESELKMLLEDTSYSSQEDEEVSDGNEEDQDNQDDENEGANEENDQEEDEDGGDSDEANDSGSESDENEEMNDDNSEQEEEGQNKEETNSSDEVSDTDEAGVEDVAEEVEDEQESEKEGVVEE